jgi:hypothetical protein
MTKVALTLNGTAPFMGAFSINYLTLYNGLAKDLDQRILVVTHL